ncbi:DUF4238 domain-containing protein [Kitasatospora griseola]|uniref:DUF4238 domain-containing protein n=1 Tax=Kitasatospora griseola TaxID=2064 RepID=UPI003855E9D7
MKRRHHTVPKFYLARFADKRGQIIRVPLPGNEKSTVSVKDASVVKNFYLLETEEGVFTDAIEDALGQIEGAAASAFRAVVDDGQWPPTDENRQAIALWAAAQHVRVPRIRQQGNEIADHIFKLQVAVGGKPQVRKVLEQAHGRKVTDEEVNEHWDEMTDFDSYRVSEHPNKHLRLIGDLMPRAAAHFFSRPWGLIRFERKSLITADDPVVLMRHPNSSPYDGVGLATAEALVIPLDRRAALVINNSSTGDDYNVSPNALLANHINQMVIFNAHRAVFHHPEDAPLDRLAMPTPAENTMSISGDPREFLMPNGWPSTSASSGGAS